MTTIKTSCPVCGDVELKPAQMRLVVCGVVAEHWVIPAEALEEHDGVPITYDDVLDFALGLDRVDLLAAMINPRVGA